MRINILYYTTEAAKSFKKNLAMSIAAVVTIAITLLILGAVVILVLNLGNVIKSIEKKVEITVYLNQDADSDAIGGLQKEILSWSEIDKVEYVSKEEALERLKEDLKDTPEMLEAISGNPLPASLEISLKDPEKVEVVADRLAGNDAIDEVKYGQGIVKKLFAVSTTVRTISLIFVLFLGFASVVLISNTVHMAVTARKKEIAFMRLVGATNWFIRWPFLFEGIIQGIIGSMIAIGSLYIFYVYLQKWIKQIIPFLPFTMSQTSFLELIGVLLLVGVFVGSLGSFIATRRFLKI